MALRLGTPPTKPPSPPADELIVELKWPGEIRSAILSGIKFGIYDDRTKRELKYRVDSHTKVIGFDKDEEVQLGYLGDQEDGSLHFHQQRVDHPMYTSLSIIFERTWTLLEQGCRVKPDITVRMYE